jgi:hypothetical protein
MPDHLKQLATIQKQRQKLHEREATLIEKRKAAIATLAEQFNLLTVDDKILNNFFAHFKEFSHEHTEKTSHNPRASSSSRSEIREVENAGT